MKGVFDREGGWVGGLEVVCLTGQVAGWAVERVPYWLEGWVAFGVSACLVGCVTAGMSGEMCLTG